MISILIEILLIGILCNGVYATTREGMIFGVIGRKLDEWADSKHWSAHLAKPLGACPYCMPSIYGTIFHMGLVYSGHVQGWHTLPLVLIGAVFLSGLLHEILNWIKKNVAK